MLLEMPKVNRLVAPQTYTFELSLPVQQSRKDQYWFLWPLSKYLIVQIESPTFKKYKYF